MVPISPAAAWVLRVLPRTSMDPTRHILPLQASQGVLEQCRLYVEAHQPVRHCDADQTGMVRLPLLQRPEVSPIVWSFVTSTCPSATARLTIAQCWRALSPGHVRGQRLASLSRDSRQAETPALVDQGFQRDSGRASSAVSPEVTGTRERQAGAVRGRPRRG